MGLGARGGSGGGYEESDGQWVSWGLGGWLVVAIIGVGLAIEESCGAIEGIWGIWGGSGGVEKQCRGSGGRLEGRGG